jgi:hypothetical protein
LRPLRTYFDGAYICRVLVMASHDFWCSCGAVPRAGVDRHW